MSNGGYAGITKDKGLAEAVRVCLRRFYKWIGLEDDTVKQLDMPGVLEVFVGERLVAVKFDLTKIQEPGPFIGPNGAHLKILQTKITLNIRGHDEPLTPRVIEQVLRNVVGPKDEYHFEVVFKEREGEQRPPEKED